MELCGVVRRWCMWWCRVYSPPVLRWMDIYRGGPSKTRAGGFPKVSLTGRKSLGDIGEISDRGGGFRGENKEGGS